MTQPVDPTVSNVPLVNMDPVNERAILAQLQRTGWTASQPVPNISYSSDPVKGPVPVIKDYSMVITDPKSGVSRKVTLSYAPGGKQPWGVLDPGDDLPATKAAPSASAGTVATKDGTLLTPKDPNDLTKGWDVVAPGKASNPDEDISTAIKRQGDEALRNERQNNDALGKGYMTDQERIAIEQRGQQLGQGQAQIDLDKKKFEEQTRQFDQQQKLKTAESGANVEQTQAQTGQIKTATQIASDAAAPNIAQTQAQTGAQQATTARTQLETKQLGAPTVQTGIGTDQPYVYQRDPTSGALTSTPNAGYVPKTPAEVAAQASRLQQLAQAKSNEIAAKVANQTYTKDQAAQEWSQWWGQNIESQKPMLQAAQQQAALDQSRQQQEQSRANLATAQTAASNVQQAYATQQQNWVGPGFGKALGQITDAYASGKAPGPIDVASAVMYKAPDLNAMMQQATAQALAHISPTAAMQATGSPTPSMAQQAPGLDINQMLNQSNYTPGGTTITIGPGGTTKVQTGQQQQQQTFPGLAQQGMPFSPPPAINPYASGGAGSVMANPYQAGQYRPFGA